jgi:hypothetical protein
MKKSLFLCGCLLLLSTLLQAQELVPSFRTLEKDLLARTQPRLDLNDVPCAIVRVSAADIETYTFEGNIIGDVIYQSGEALVYMTKGSRNITIKSNKFGMLKFDFPQRLEKQVVYKLDLKLILPEDQKRKTLIMAEGGFHPSHTSFGVMAGIVAKHGAYVRFRSDFGSTSADLECDDTVALTSGGTGTPYYIEGSSAKSRLSITGGYLYRFIKPLYGYIGGGYGQRTLAWETVEGEWVKNIDHSASGIAAEIGLIGQYKGMALSLGVQTINFKYMELNVGVGFFF